MTQRALLVAALVGALAIASASSRAAAPIRIMLLDGESGGPYHQWQLTTRVLKKQLDETGLFDVDVVTAPPAGSSFNAFKPAFTGYQAVVLNYDAPDQRWPAELKAAFERYVSDGGGLVVVHASDNAFPGWTAFNEMIGIGGWRDRNEKTGPLWFYKDGKLTSDTAPGRAGSHGQRLPFKVTVRDQNHPITRGLPAVWMHQGDELYAKLRGPGQHMTVLATAYSDPGNNGTGRDEPQLMVLSYGKGRVFHTTMGHDVSALSSVDFVVTFQRGTEWAAIGSVTQKIPSDFPTPDKVSFRADLAAMDQAPAPAGGRGQASPAAVPPPATATPQSYPPEQVRTGQPIFSAQCGFCHGRDAMGGETGPDLTRAASVAADVRGDTLGPIVRNGRADKGMPAFALGDADLAAVVAFIHDQKSKAASLTGGRRGVELADLQTGNAEAGKKYFAGACSKCHSPSGDFAGLAKRLEGLALLQRMLYPSGAAAAARAKVTVTPASGPAITGSLAYRDEFTIALTDPSGAYRAFPVDRVKFTVDNPLDAHVEQLGKYTDDDMHNVLAYLHTLR